MTLFLRISIYKRLDSYRYLRYRIRISTRYSSSLVCGSFVDHHIFNETHKIWLAIGAAFFDGKSCGLKDFWGTFFCISIR